jgi:hypothetical protein
VGRVGATELVTAVTTTKLIQTGKRCGFAERKVQARKISTTNQTPETALAEELYGTGGSGSPGPGGGRDGKGGDVFSRALSTQKSCKRVAAVARQTVKVWRIMVSIYCPCGRTGLMERMLPQVRQSCQAMETNVDVRNDIAGRTEVVGDVVVEETAVVKSELGYDQSSDSQA